MDLMQLFVEWIKLDDFGHLGNGPERQRRLLKWKRGYEKMQRIASQKEIQQISDEYWSQPND